MAFRKDGKLRLGKTVICRRPYRRALRLTVSWKSCKRIFVAITYIVPLDFLEIFQEAFCACVKYQFLREFRLGQKRFKIIIFGYHGRNVCIAA